jgi:nucleotide-binding universal stress UspA family protein
MRDGAPPRRLLLPLDGSWRSESALLPAVPLATRAGARLVLMTTQWSVSELSTSEHYLEERREDLRAGKVGGVAIDCDIEIVLDRDAQAAIIAAADEPGTMICMATHGHGGVVRGVLGSVSEAVVRSGVAPVLLVGPDLDRQWTLPDAPELLVALDGSHTAREAVPAAIALSGAVGGRLRLVHVPPPGDLDDADPAGTAATMLERVQATCRDAGIDTAAEVRDGFDPAKVIAEAASRRNSAFVVAATHGRTGLARVTLGSVVQRIVRHSACPVLVVRPLVLGAETGDDESGADGSRHGRGSGTGKEARDARGGWRRGRGRSQPSRSAASQG